MSIFIILAKLIDLLVALIFVRIVLSWLNPRAMMFPSNPFFKLVFNLTEPLMAPIRGLIPAVGYFDFSCVILLMGLGFLRQILMMFAG